MHDCQATKARLVDLIFGEAEDAARLLGEVRSCASCAAEHRALSETLRAFDRAADEAQPAETFWPRYHARLAERIDAAVLEAPLTADDGARAPSPSPLAWLRRALAARWSVPAPAAVAALLLIACLTTFALRPSPAAVSTLPRANDPAPPAADATPAAGASQIVRTIEVPVVQEKIVTRTIYVERRARERTGAAARDGARLLAGARPAGVEVAPRPDTLTGFRPAGDVKFRVIKENFEDER